MVVVICVTHVSGDHSFCLFDMICMFVRRLSLVDSISLIRLAKLDFQSRGGFVNG